MTEEFSDANDSPGFLYEDETRRRIDESSDMRRKMEPRRRKTRLEHLDNTWSTPGTMKRRGMKGWVVHVLEPENVGVSCLGV